MRCREEFILPCIWTGLLWPATGAIPPHSEPLPPHCHCQSVPSPITRPRAAPQPPQTSQINHILRTNSRGRAASTVSNLICPSPVSLNTHAVHTHISCLSLWEAQATVSAPPSRKNLLGVRRNKSQSNSNANQKIGSCLHNWGFISSLGKREASLKRACNVLIKSAEGGST